MSQRSRGRQPRPAPPKVATGTVDMAAVQGRIVEQLQEAEIKLRELDDAREQLQARIWRLQGQLELTMELSQQVSRPPGPPNDGPAGEAARDGAVVTEGGGAPA